VIEHPWPALLVLAVALAACDETRPSPLSSSTSSGSSSNGTGGSSGGGGGGGGEGGTAGGGGASCEADLGLLSVSAVEDGDCVAHGGAEVAIYPGDSGAPIFGRLAAVAGRRVASFSQGFAGFVLFDADGSNASASLIGSSRRVASEGDTVGEAWRSGTTPYYDVLYQRYDATGAPVGGPVELASGEVAEGGPWIAGNDSGESLVIWALGGRLRARGISSAGSPAGDPFDFGEGTFDTAVTLSATAGAGGYAVAWSGEPQPGTHSTWFALTTSTALSGQAHEIASSCSATHRVLRLVALTNGYSLLLEAGAPPDLSVYLLYLDAEGQPEGAARRLAGAVAGWDLAARPDDELGVVVSHAGQETRFRPFDAAGEPLGSWVCLAGTGGLFNRAAIDADGSGYAAMYWQPGNTEMFARFDRLGTGAP